MNLRVRMQPTYLSLVQIFGAPTRYTVPLFQRPYVWNREEQWQPLWDDIVNLAERVLAVERGKPVAGHFLGTVVLEQAMTATGTIACREIVDGQQRLTTLQILLKAAEHVIAQEALGLKDGDEAAARETGVAARQIAILTANTAYADDDEKYKVWPTNDDRDAFRQVMDAVGPDAVPTQGPLMVQAYHFFHKALRKWLHVGQEIGTRAAALGAALQTHVRAIVLDLEEVDEPQAIFETLNAHGTPLLPADLIKNWLLWEAARQRVKNIDALYQTWWRPFDRDPDYWRVNIGTGHAARPRVDTFLQNWLTRRTRAMIPPKHLYDRFLRHIEKVQQADGAPKSVCDLPALMSDIYHDGLRYREIENPTGSSRFHTFLRRLSSVGIVVFHPVLLVLMGRQGSDAADRDSAAISLESYLVRRIVCWEETRGYNEVMLNLLSAIAELDPTAPAAPMIAEILGGQSAEAYRWPDDTKFRNEWASNRFYGGYRRARVMMILQALEEHFQREGDKGEPIVTFDFSGLEIEHILPQEWERHWPLPPGEGARIERERRLHGIGNLTLVTGKLNPTLSNAAWLDGPNAEGKRSALDAHSKLQLNAQLVKRYPESWNEAEIDHRASALFEAACRVWPASGKV
jgi:hypothetical protein